MSYKLETSVREKRGLRCDKSSVRFILICVKLHHINEINMEKNKF